MHEITPAGGRDHFLPKNVKEGPPPQKKPKKISPGYLRLFTTTCNRRLLYRERLCQPEMRIWQISGLGMNKRMPCWWFAGAQGLLNLLPSDGGLRVLFRVVLFKWPADNDLTHLPPGRRNTSVLTTWISITELPMINSRESWKLPAGHMLMRRPDNLSFRAFLKDRGRQTLWGGLRSFSLIGLHVVFHRLLES